ncbi:PAS domain S-box-containing protein/diguanylate cyclase (GGDEF) domain-containing protein [Clostridium cavendishii DSM 21758]|uniref:PAS domain S-box-containing protein/diguanylate cyclase (GGDEF) domain-containing protein n=1 Tax=Clostridium cavendishii DSM 21758 TaxID=1121302 RepID=A0A1M6RVU3_9CLOT|nr:diguanylate cyclase [Clostridium cavendishii]SHK36622.1 PAS domain S-box-containing protein/diguanylate cyclase (GGDEF) domain-containing protein [Clostridium cavendishii DSM 21758]
MTLLNNYNEFQLTRELNIKIDSNGIIVSISPNCYDILGFHLNEIINTYINNYLDQNLDTTVINSSIQVLSTKKNGEKLYLDIFAKPLIDNKANNIGLELSCFDISKYINLERNLTNFSKILEKGKDIIFKYELKPTHKFTYINPAIKHVLGFDANDFYNDLYLPFKLVHPDDFEIQKSKTDKNSDFSKMFCTRFKHKNGNYIWIEDYIIPTFDINGDLIYIEGISRNVTERKELEKKLETLSYHDGLTKLYNRTYLNKQIELLITDSDTPIGIIVCDLDNLKYINDTLGHSSGDLLIRNVSKFFKNTFNKDSILVRNGGDEFIIILPNTTLKESQNMYKKMLHEIEEYNINSKMPIHLSSGFSYSSSSKNILNLLSEADKNMYKNKYMKKHYMLY